MKEKYEKWYEGKNNKVEVLKERKNYMICKKIDKNKERLRERNF
jgi:phage anti-repressor protein